MKKLEIPLDWAITQPDADKLLNELLQKDLRNYFPNTIEEFFKSPHEWILVDFLREIQFLASSSVFSQTVNKFFKDPSLKRMYSIAKQHTTYDDTNGLDSVLASKSLEHRMEFIHTSLLVLNESITATMNGGYPYPDFEGKYPPAILFYFYDESTPIKYRGHIFIQETRLFAKTSALFFVSIYKSVLTVGKQPGFADDVLTAVEKKATQMGKDYLWTIPFRSMMEKLKERGFTTDLTLNVNGIDPSMVFRKKLPKPTSGGKRTRKDVSKRKRKTRRSPKIFRSK
jgi:hypothetical protein